MSGQWPVVGSLQGDITDTADHLVTGHQPLATTEKQWHVSQESIFH